MYSRLKSKYALSGKSSLVLVYFNSGLTQFVVNAMKNIFVFCLLITLMPHFAHAEDIVDIAFPVDGEVSFTDDYLDQRVGHIHHAIDILSDKMTPILAADDGVITFAPMTEPSYGYMLNLRGDSSYSFAYVHINNDTPGTDDGQGGIANAYAPGIEQGARVNRGDVIAWVGDSGNAESTAPHLHFEIEGPDGASINPYASLMAVLDAVTYSPKVELELADSINVDKDIPEATEAVNCVSDTLIRTPEVSTVYYCGRDGGRYVFLDEKTYFSWYTNFDDVEYVTTETMASIPLSGTVTYKPGSYLVKLMSDPKVYAISRNGTLRWIPSAILASELYGADWASQVRDIPDGFFPRYQIGPDITE